MERTTKLDPKHIVVGVNHRQCEFARRLDSIPDNATPVTTVDQLRGRDGSCTIYLLIGHPEFYPEDVIRQVQMFAALYNNVRMIKT